MTTDSPGERDPPLTGPYTEDDPFHEPLVLLGFLAACTTTIELEVAVLVLPKRQTVLVAKQAAEVDVLSGGRLLLAVGTGWNYVEYDSMGMPFADRGRRLDEQVDLLRQLWREPVVDYHGEYHRVDRAGLRPLPTRGAVPVWFGGGAETSLRRAARSGEGFVFGSSGPRTHLRAGRLHELLAEQGRDARAFPMEAMIDFSLGPRFWTGEVPAWQQRVRDDPSRANAIVEEAVRLASPSAAVFRQVTRDTTLGGVALPAGAQLVVSLLSANRDESVFPDPDRFLPDRPPVQRHIAFGQGVHACIGNSLARMEARQAVRALARHAEHISVAAGPGLRYLPSIIVRGLVELPVRVTRRRGRDAA